jgi:hypothetical protein
MRYFTRWVVNGSSGHQPVYKPRAAHPHTADVEQPRLRLPPGHQTARAGGHSLPTSYRKKNIGRDRQQHLIAFSYSALGQTGSNFHRNSKERLKQQQQALTDSFYTMTK